MSSSSSIEENNSLNPLPTAHDASVCGKRGRNDDAIVTPSKEADLLKHLKQNLSQGQHINRVVTTMECLVTKAAEWAAQTQINPRLLNSPTNSVQVLERYDEIGKFKNVKLLQGFTTGSRVTEFLLHYHHVHPNPHANEAQMQRRALITVLAQAMLLSSK